MWAKVKKFYPKSPQSSHQLKTHESEVDISNVTSSSSLTVLSIFPKQKGIKALLYLPHIPLDTEPSRAAVCGME